MIVLITKVFHSSGIKTILPLSQALRWRVKSFNKKALHMTSVRQNPVNEFSESIKDVDATGTNRKTSNEI